MQAIIIANTEPSQLAQLSANGVFCTLPFDSKPILINQIDILLTSELTDITITHRPDQLPAIEKCINAWFGDLIKSEKRININYLESSSSNLADILKQVVMLKGTEFIFLIQSNSCCQSLSPTGCKQLDLRQVFLTLIRAQQHGGQSPASAVFSSFPPSSPSVDSKSLLKVLHKNIMLLAMPFAGSTASSRKSPSSILAYYPASSINKNSRLDKQLIHALNNTISDDTCFGMDIRSDLHELGIYLVKRPFFQVLCRVRTGQLTQRKRTLWQHIEALLNDKNCPELESSGKRIEGDTSPDLDGVEEDRSQCCWPKKRDGRPPLHVTSLYEHVNCQSVSAESGCNDKTINETALLIRPETPDVYAEALRLLIRRKSTVKPNDPRGLVSPKCRLEADCTVTASMLSDNCSVGSGSRLNGSIVLRGTAIEANCTIQNCLLGENVTIGTDCVLKNCSVASGQKVPSGTNISSDLLGFIDVDLDESGAI